MYRKTVWFKMAYPLKPGDMSKAFKGAKKRRARRVRDKNNPGSWVELPCSFERMERDGNYIVNVTLVHQVRARSDMEYQSRDLVKVKARQRARSGRARTWSTRGRRTTWPSYSYRASASSS